MTGCPSTTRLSGIRYLALRTFLISLLVGCSVLYSRCGQAGLSTVDGRVAELIEQMMNGTEHKAFLELEALGCSAVPAVIERLDDRRRLPVPRISLRNTRSSAFEGLRHYSPQQVVDALAAILNQVTGQD